LAVILELEELVIGRICSCGWLFNLISSWFDFFVLVSVFKLDASLFRFSFSIGLLLFTFINFEDGTEN
jgi:hypothetical protein